MSKRKNIIQTITNLNYLSTFKTKTPKTYVKHYQSLLKLSKDLTNYLDQLKNNFKNNILSLTSSNQNPKQSFTTIINNTYDLVNQIDAYQKSLTKHTIINYTKHRHVQVPSNPQYYLNQIKHLLNKIYFPGYGLLNQIQTFKSYLFSYYYYVGDKLINNKIHNYIYSVPLHNKCLFNKPLNNTSNFKKALKDYKHFFHNLSFSY